MFLNVVLYRYDRPSVVKQMPGPELERKIRKIIETFKKFLSKFIFTNIKTTTKEIHGGTKVIFSDDKDINRK